MAYKSSFLNYSCSRFQSEPTAVSGSLMDPVTLCCRISWYLIFNKRQGILSLVPFFSYSLANVCFLFQPDFFMYLNICSDFWLLLKSLCLYFTHYILHLWFLQLQTHSILLFKGILPFVIITSQMSFSDLSIPHHLLDFPDINKSSISVNKIHIHCQ